jgi:hypothetical protein
MGVALVLWLRKAPSKASQLHPLLADIDRYKSTNGIYPTSCASFASFSNLTQRFKVYTGAQGTNGVEWDTYEFNSHDFTDMVDRAGYEVFLPTGRMKMISFTSFKVWRYSSADHRWQKGRIHWSYGFGNSYWSAD